ncbi:MAG: hypothetical protein ACKPKO_53970, partial [Candidatus Fonsibacter sp.]
MVPFIILCYFVSRGVGSLAADIGDIVTRDYDASCYYPAVYTGLCPMDPTPAEQATLTTLDAVADWVGLVGVATDVTTPRGALWGLLGTTATTLPRFVAAMPEPDLEALLG